ncbi:hypothetical protein [Thalassiella azotivora]
MTPDRDPAAAARGASWRVDPQALHAASLSVRSVSLDLADDADALLRHAPDPGTPPAPDAVLAAHAATVDVLRALADVADRTGTALRWAAERYAEADTPTTGRSPHGAGDPAGDR